MSRLLYLCGPEGPVCTMGVADTSPGIDTTLGRVPPADLIASTQAELTLPGADANGDVLVKAFHGGTLGNSISLEVVDGPLGISVNLDNEITVARQAGDSAQDVADLINGDPQASALVTAEAQGTGASDVSVMAPTELAGGADNGHSVKFAGRYPTARRITRIEVV